VSEGCVGKLVGHPAVIAEHVIFLFVILFLTSKPKVCFLLLAKIEYISPKFTRNNTQVK